MEMEDARNIELSNQLIPLRIQNVEYATPSGFPGFARKMWSHLENVLFDEILRTLRTDDLEVK